MVKGERKDHRWAGSSADLTFDVNPDSSRLHQVRCIKLFDLLAFGYVDNEDVDWWSSLVRKARSSDGTEPRSRSGAAIKATDFNIDDSRGSFFNAPLNFGTPAGQTST